MLLKTEHCINFNFIMLPASVIPYQLFHYLCSCKNSLEDTLNALFDMNIAGDVSKVFQILLTRQLEK